MYKMTMVFKSGKEYRFKCKTYSMETLSATGSLWSFSYEGGVGECPVYFKTEDIESIAVEKVEGDD